MKMKTKHVQFVNVQGGVDSDVGGVVDVTATLINTPYDMMAAAA